MTRVSPYSRIGNENTYQVKTAQELMQASGLDWTVELADIYAAGSYDSIKVEDRFATMRVDKNGAESVLSVVGSRYKVFQNHEMFGVLDDVVRNGDAKYGSAGELNGGKVVWTVLDLPQNITVGNDEHNGYILARTSHDGSHPFEITPMVNRISCTNQINTMMFNNRKAGLYYSMRHSLNSVIDVDDIRAMFNFVKEDIAEYVRASNWLLGISFNDKDFKNFLHRVYPLPAAIEFTNDDMLSVGQRKSKYAALNKRDKATLIWNGQTGTQDSIAGTKFAAFQTIVEASDWFSRNQTKQAEKIVMSKDNAIKSRALELLGVN